MHLGYPDSTYRPNHIFCQFVLFISLKVSSHLVSCHAVNPITLEVMFVNNLVSDINDNQDHPIPTISFVRFWNFQFQQTKTTSPQLISAREQQIRARRSISELWIQNQSFDLKSYRLTWKRNQPPFFIENLAGFPGSKISSSSSLSIIYNSKFPVMQSVQF